MRERKRFEHEMADLRGESAPPRRSFQQSPPTTRKQFLLVACFDYEAPNHNLSGYCVNRIQRLLNKTRGASTDPNVSFTLFDVKTGKVKTFDVSSAGKRVWKENASFTPVTKANYTGKKFDKNPAGVMSITDVYDFVRGIGRNEPGTLQELSFFGHGWHGGPILVNSKDHSTTAARDPNDKDGRAQKDFIAPTMDAARLAELSAAFAPQGFTWLWGCVFAKVPFQVLHRLFKNTKYRGGTLKAGDLIELRFGKDLASELFPQAPSFFPAQRSDGTFALSFHRSLNDIKDLCRLMIDLSYCKKIATATQRRCFGALPGTYSDYEKQVRLPLMLVPRKIPPYSDNFGMYLNFYRKHMGVSLDPEGRGYGEHLP